MNFKENKAIYLQIADRLCNEILLEQYKEEERVPSVREYAAVVEVNFNTVMRSYDYLQSQGIIYNKRGIGYFVSTGAKQHIHSFQKENFMQNELTGFFRQLDLLQIPLSEITVLYNEYKKQQSLNSRSNETDN
ncbi:GntR family transcriptional regulator [Parabacteroides sp. Marseille-P3160]|jgi:DNA-binding transcriptional regulator YhcF (GntR family)|uniref:GntR family transcriptional regulator n=1 Tax=Parabacteroides sp. Marseille-P3160 TaxID=1917887 RepID=UPI0009B9DE64|nr:GntR family transcriptional regulator [Parabacteroides sp. Marseille-P3160]